MCNESPEGVLYYKVGETKNFAVELAKELDMKIAPSNILDIALGYIFFVNIHKIRC